MRRLILPLLVLLFTVGLYSVDNFYLNGLNEVSYIYRTAPDSLNSYFRDAFSYTLMYKDFTLGMKFLAELPKYETDQSQLLDDLSSNRLSTEWTERFLEFEKDNLLLHGGTISESFGSGMVFRGWQDLEFDTDTRLEGFMVKYNSKLQIKALYGALPNRNQPVKSDLVYGADAWLPLKGGYDFGASILTMRTLTALNEYNQQDVFAGRLNWNFDNLDGGAEYALTSLFKNAGANHEGSAVNAYANLYLKPQFVQTLTLGAGYKKYDKFQYRTQDLKTFNYHNETLADNQAAGEDEEGMQGWASMVISDEFVYNVNYAEAWDSAFSKRMNDLYTSLEWVKDSQTWLFEYGHIEKLDKATDHWQKDLIPAVSFSMPLGNYAFTTKAEYEYIEKVNHDIKDWYYRPLLQVDLGMGGISVSTSAESHWQNAGDVMGGRYWANCEVKYALFSHTDVTVFAGREAGGKVCRNGVCRYVAPFQGIKLEASTRF
jgi:hypothetical protein